jgi:hypothetical protein
MAQCRLNAPQYLEQTGSSAVIGLNVLSICFLRLGGYHDSFADVFISAHCSSKPYGGLPTEQEHTVARRRCRDNVRKPRTTTVKRSTAWPGVQNSESDRIFVGKNA